MELEELKKRLGKFGLGEIKPSKHAFRRIQDEKRKINYPKIVSLLLSLEGLYRFQEQPAKNPDEIKLKLWFKLNYIYDMNIYIVINREHKEKGLNRLKIISCHKVKRTIQREIEKHENKI